jgi:hypothetical protein
LAELPYWGVSFISYVNTHIFVREICLSGSCIEYAFWLIAGDGEEMVVRPNAHRGQYHKVSVEERVRH